MSDTNGGYAEGDNREWHHQKITEYFTECGKIYDTFEEYIDEVALALNDFVNDSEHRGPEAESSKAFVNERQLEAVQEAIYSIEHLHGMMIGGKLSDEISLVDDFNDKVDASENAIVKSQQLDKIISDYTDYNNDFRTTSDTIKTARDACQEAIAGCSFLTYSKFTEPDPEPSKEAFEAFVSVEGEEGFVQKFKKTYLDFMEEHSDDFSNSEFMAICPALLENLRNVNAALGDGSFDLTRYYETFQNVKWTDVKDLLSEEDRQKFLKFLETFSLYLKGLVPRCQVYKYDPVNMCNGNYINDRTDLTVPGRFPISFRRFYNAQSDRVGLLGNGWSCVFDSRLVKDKDDDYRLNTFDGRELVYRKTTLGKEELYLEIHGEEGILREIQNGFKVTHDNGYYEEYDADGFLVAKGDHNGENTTIVYTTIYRNGNIEGNAELIALPERVSTKSGAIVKFIYNKNGLLTKIEDHTGRSCRYEYEEIKDDKTSSIAHRLVQIIYPDETCRRYKYDDQGMIVESISQDEIVALKNEYDSKKRVIHQIFPDGGEMSYEYDDEKHITIATEQNGCKVQYLSDEFGRHIGTRYPEQGVEEKYTYNDKNQKTSVTDRNGFTTRFTYDSKGHITGIIGPEGLHETYTYNAEGKLSSRKDSEGNKYKYKYDLEDNLCCVIDPEGNKTKYDYRDGMIVAIRDAENNKTLFEQDRNGNIVKIVDPSGVCLNYEYDELNRVKATIDAKGSRTEYGYDSMNRIVAIKDPLCNETSIEYTKSGKVQKVTYPDETRREWAYNSIGKPCSFTDEENNRTRLIYDTSWRKEKMILPNGGEVKYEYDLLGNLVSITNAEGRKTGYGYDKTGKIISMMKYPSSGDEMDCQVTVMSRKYDGLGRVKEETDGNGGIKKYDYDKNGNLLSIIDANGGETKFAYDKTGRLVERIDPVGNRTSYSYNKIGKIKTAEYPGGVIKENHYKSGRLVKVTKRNSCSDSEQLLKSFEYDICGRVSKIVENDGFYTEYSHDKCGRVDKVSFSSGRTIEYSYDRRGRITRVNDCGLVTNYSYTKTGKLKTVSDPMGSGIRYEYNELGLMTSIEKVGNAKIADRIIADDPRRHITLYEYDAAGNVTGIIDADGNKEEYRYDYLGNISERVDRDGNLTKYVWDLNDNLKQIEYADGNKVSYAYNALNVLKEVRDSLGLTQIESDDIGRTTKVIYPEGEEASYLYSANGKKERVNYPSGTYIEYRYDNDGNLSEMISFAGDAEATKENKIVYDYNDGLISKKVMPNGVQTEYKYYQGGKLKSIRHYNEKKTLDSYEYEYDLVGNTIKIVRSRDELGDYSGVFDFKYDNNGRVTEVFQNGISIRKYQYDGFGNRALYEDKDKTCEYFYDELDRLCLQRINTKSEKDSVSVIREYEYDRRGNLIKEKENHATLLECGFDAANHLVFQKEKEVKTLYRYNGLNKRVGKTTNGKEEKYFTDLTKEYGDLLELSSGENKESFFYDAKNVVSMNKAGVDYYYLHDEVGSVMRLTGTDGSSALDYAFDEFGNDLLGCSDNGFSWAKSRKNYYVDGNIIQPFAFAGYQIDAGHRNMYAQARYYDNQSGRFISKDDEIYISKAEPETHNLYIYCANNPLKYTDPNGHYTKEEGKEAHLMLQALFLMQYGIPQEINGEIVQGFVEVPIPGASSKGNGNKGYADMVLVIGDTAEVYEIKSANAANEYIRVNNPADPGGSKITYPELVQQQIDRYIGLLPDSPGFGHITDVEYGTTFKPLYIVPSLENKGQYIVYFTLEENPGVIYYEYVGEIPDGQEALVKVPEEEYIEKARKKFNPDALIELEYELEMELEYLKQVNSNSSFNFNLNLNIDWNIVGTILLVLSGAAAVCAIMALFGVEFAAAFAIFLLVSAIMEAANSCEA
ncbi:DUF6531 domain-containing protein [Butyrivibrio proteoclasticus]|uniref:DUF6531 domain-containing protein n=1 Tax=Butyrivibrio proteoclasticus TaxID=43305 RepID=UPI00047EDF5C|nr:DUF6531 domain-containing protein [Butyrivibrio proteoclasticus]